MDYGILIGLIGTLATLIFGLVGIILPFRERHFASLDFIEEDSINLYDSVVKNISDLSIQFKNTPIKENVHLLRGFLINSGMNDITSQMVEKKFQICLGEKSIWLNANLINTSKDLKVDLLCEKNVLTIDLGLIRYNEFAYIEAIIETPNNKELKSEIYFEHRIANIGKTKYRKISEFNLLKEIANYCFYLILILGIYLFTDFNKLNFFDLKIKEISNVSNDEKLIKDRTYSKFKEDTLRDLKGLIEIEDSSIQNRKLLINIGEPPVIYQGNVQDYERDYFLRKLICEKYNYFQLLILGETEPFQLNDDIQVKYTIKRYFNGFYLVIGAIVFLVIAILLSKKIIQYFKLRPIQKILLIEISKRKNKNEISK